MSGDINWNTETSVLKYFNKIIGNNQKYETRILGTFRKNRFNNN